MYQNYLISAANCQVASYYWVLLAVCPCRSSSEDHALERTCTTQTRTHTQCNMDDNYIHACLESLRGSRTAARTITPLFPVCAGKGLRVIVLFGCARISSDTSVTQPQMQIMRCPIKEQTVCSLFRCFPSPWNSSGCDFTAPPLLTSV